MTLVEVYRSGGISWDNFSKAASRGFMPASIEALVEVEALVRSD